jgi:hypothetical protein
VSILCDKLTKIKFNELSEVVINNCSDMVNNYVSANLSDFDAVSFNNIHCCPPGHIRQIDCLRNMLNVCFAHASIDSLFQQ